MKQNENTRAKSRLLDSDRHGRFNRLVGILRRDMYRYAIWLCRDKAIAEDIVQEALLRAWRSLDSLREDAAAKPWLMTIVRRENARYFASKRLDTVDIDNLTASQSAILAKTDDSDTDSIRQAIFELRDDYREPLVLQVLIGNSTQEIAEIMGISQGAVLTRLHRARNRLKAKIMAAPEKLSQVVTGFLEDKAPSSAVDTEVSGDALIVPV